MPGANPNVEHLKNDSVWQHSIMKFEIWGSSLGGIRKNTNETENIRNRIHKTFFVIYKWAK
jgi:3'-phosphoadenosine 5'-phosphosulfate sulfotransferase